MPQAQSIIEGLLEEAKNYNRIYVTSIHHDLTENDIQSVFEAFGKIKSCELASDPTKPGKHKGYGYIEYETAQAVQDAVASMNLFDLGGQFLRVGKCVTPPDVAVVPTCPSSMPTAAAVAAAAVTAKITAMDLTAQTSPAKAPEPTPVVPPAPTGSRLSKLGPPVSNIQPPTVATVVPGLPAGLPAAVPAPGVVIPQLSMVPNSNNVGAPGVAAVPQPVSAIQVPPAAPVPPVQEKPGHNQELTEAQKKLVSEEQAQTLDAQENMKISGSNARHMVMQKLMRNTEETVMVLRNMVGPEDLDEELESEVTDECGKYGDVKRVIIYQELQGEEEGAEVLVKIFVVFEKQHEMEGACNALNGRFFGGRIVKAERYDSDLFQANDLSG